MASVFGREGGWVVKWKDGAGKWRTRRTNCATKAEAKRMAADLERQADRQQLGLDARPSDSTMKLGELCAWWLEHKCPETSRDTEKQRLEKHIISQPIGAIALPR